MICPNCGNNVDNGNFCPACGTQFGNQQPMQQQMQGQPMMVQPAQNKSKLYVGLVCGILGLLIAGIPLGAVALGLGLSHKENSGLKIAVIVLGAFDIVGVILVLSGVLG